MIWKFSIDFSVPKPLLKYGCYMWIALWQDTQAGMSLLLVLSWSGLPMPQNRPLWNIILQGLEKGPCPPLAGEKDSSIQLWILQVGSWDSCGCSATSTGPGLGGDERSPGCQMKEAFTFRVTVAQAFFLAMPHGLWDLISLTKDHTWAPSSDSAET